MAGAAFKDATFVQTVMNSFVPVLVDGDTEKEIVGKFSVNGYPHVKFVDTTEKSHGQIEGFVATNEALGKVQAAAKAAPQQRPSKDYKKIYAASQDLAKAMAKQKYTDALKAIQELEKAPHKGLDLLRAQVAKAEIVKIAQKELDEAKALIESKPDKAKSELMKISKTYAGLEIAEEAKKLVQGITEQTGG